MAGENNDAEGGQSLTQAVEIIDSKDWCLQAAVETMANNGIEFSVTLTVGGLIISGTLISGRTYFTELAEFVRASSKEDGDILSQMADSWGALAKLYDPPEDAREDWEPPQAAYIHLRGAKFFTPGQIPMPNNGGFLWRGKISAVDGFSFVSIAER